MGIPQIFQMGRKKKKKKKKNSNQTEIPSSYLLKLPSYSICHVYSESMNEVSMALLKGQSFNIAPDHIMSYLVKNFHESFISPSTADHFN